MNRSAHSPAPATTATGRGALPPAALRLLEQRLRGIEAPAAPLIARLEPRPETAALSSAQQRLYFLDRLEPGGTDYLMPVAWRLSGPVDAAALDAALTDLVRRHEQLRTCFPDRDGAPFQRILPPPTRLLNLIDLSALPTSERAEAADAAVRDAADRPFALDREPAFRATLVRLAETEHRLVFGMHHIIADAWSLPILTRDLQRFYRERLSGRSPRVESSGIDYADFAAWERGSGRDLETKLDLEYWREMLGGLDELDLPTDFPRPDSRGRGGAAHTVVLSEQLSAQLAELGNRADATPFMTLLCAFQAALGFHCGQDDLAVGIVTANRELPQLESVVGFFVNTLVMRADLSGDPTPIDLLARTRARTLDALSHQSAPFERVVDACAPERDPSRNPLFQVLFAYDGEAGDEPVFELGDARAEPLPLGGATAKFDLSLHASRDERGCYRLSFIYRPDLFAPRTVERLAGHCTSVLEAFAAAPNKPLSGADLLDSGERARLLDLAAPHGEAGKHQQYLAVLDRFARHVQQSPDAVAVSCADRSLSYAQLDTEARALARRLRVLGAGPETLIGICTSRSERFAVAVLGIWLAGAAYLPLDPTYPQPRLAYMLEDAGVEFVLADEHGRAAVDGLPTAILRLDAEDAADADADAAANAEGCRSSEGARLVMRRLNGPFDQVGKARTLRRSTPNAEGAADANTTATAADPLSAPPGPGHLAYVIYTSGSTGRPKGVEITHGNLAWLLDSAERHFDFGPQDVWTLMHSFSFDFSVWELWGPLTTGGRAVVLTKDEVRDPDAVHEVLRRERVTILNQTPAAFKGLRAHMDRAGLGFEQLPLRTVIFGGDAFDTRDYRDWFAAVAAGRRLPALVNMYGITETTVHVTHRLIGPADPEAAVHSPIGAALAGQRCYVLDRHRRLVPQGAVGELHVSGGGVARGYRNRPELTAERFVPDPFSGDGGLMYRTGDLVRMLPDGTLSYLGRADRQVKIRGFRIEPGEIEGALRDCPGIADAAVVAAPGPRGGEARLVGHLVLDASAAADFDQAALRERLRLTLPEHMVPALYLRHEALPVTANGKVDRAALAALARSASVEAAAPGRRYVAPRTDTEKLLAGIWAEVLESSAPSTTDNFFDLGGDSILALRVSGLAQSAGLAVGVADVFRARTLAALAETADLAGAPTSAADASIQPFALLDSAERSRLPGDVIDAYPLTLLQLGMLHELLADPERGAYHNVTALRITVPGFGLACFQAAVDAVVRHHDILRTSFNLADYGEPLQLVHRAAALPVGYTDLRGMPTGEQRASVARHVEREAVRRFDLAEAPLLRLHLHHLEGDELQITLTDCHVVLDGWSLTSLVADLIELHARAAAGLAFDQPEAPRFADYVALEQDALHSLESLDYWRGVLDRLEPVRFPRRPAAAPQAGANAGEDSASVLVHEAVRAYPELSEAIGALARRAGVPRRTVLLTAFHHALGLFAQPDGYGSVPHAIGMITNGRPEKPGADRMRGLFLNTVLFGLADPPEPSAETETWTGLLGRAFSAERELLPHRHFPLARLQQERPEQGALVQAVFNYVNFHRLPVRAWSGSMEVARTTFPLALNANPSGFTLDADAEYFDAATAEELADLIGAVIAAMVADPEARADRPRLSGAARKRALEDFARGPSIENEPLRFHEIVRRHAARRPDAIAVDHLAGEGNGNTSADTLSYAQLCTEADELAARLRGLGVGPETIVGVCADRGPRMIRAMLAVHAAGGAFLPLDPRYPADRLAFMATDSGMAVLLTESALVGTVPYQGTTVLLDEPAKPLAGAAYQNSDPYVGTSGSAGDALAYVIYTSGSTGTPKGTAVTHRGMTNLIEAQRDHLRPTPADRVLQFASCSFDACIYELVWALANGAALCTAPVDALRPGPDLDRTLREGRITAAVLAPTALASLALLNSEPLHELRTLMAAGEACPPDAAAAWSGGRRFLNGYGLTETSVWSNAALVDGADPRPPIGQPIRNAEVYVLDQRMEPVPVGVPGEIYVGGHCLARGYLNRAGLTASRFVADPFGTPGGRLLRTGDIGRHRADGSLEFLGRRDSQVKLRGQRVELGEIEAALRELPQVREAVVLLRTDLPGGEPALVAYVVPAQDAENADATEALRSALRGRLPASMVPAHFVTLDAFPTTGSEKVDRAALPLPQVRRAGLAAAYTAPRSPLEVVLADVLREVLGLDEVGVFDDFFDLGGTSLSTVRAAAKAAARGVSITVRDLVEAPTIAQLALRARRCATGSGKVSVAEHAVPCEAATARPIISRVSLRAAAADADSPAPLYCVHPTGGSAAWYIQLARALAPGRAVTGFQARGLLGGVDPRTVQGIAANYAAEIRDAARPGPHAVLGWSMGADIALELGRALLNTGERAAPLILIEPYLPNPIARRRLNGFVDDMSRALLLRERLRTLMADGSDPAASAETARQLHAVLLGAGLARQEADLAADAPIEVWHSLLAAMADYEIEPYHGPVHLIVSEFAATVPAGEPVPGLDIGFAAYVDRWRELVPAGLTVHRMPGDHRSMLTEPAVTQLAALVDELLAEGEEDAR